MRTVSLLFVMIFTAMFMMACEPQPPSTSKQQEGQRDSAMDRAHSSVQIPTTQNFLTRETVAEFMRRTDEPDKTFYIYVLADTGQIIGYYVSRGRPVNICTFLSPPDKVERKPGGGYVKRAAPGMDGVYYGAGACGSDYFFDAETDTMVELHGLKMFVADQPLELDAEPIRVSSG